MGDVTKDILYLLEVGFEEIRLNIHLISTFSSEQTAYKLDTYIIFTTDLLESIIGLNNITIAISGDTDKFKL